MSRGTENKVEGSVANNKNVCYNIKKLNFLRTEGEGLSGEKKYRHEYKYVISGGCYHILRGRLKAAMKPDPHGKNGVYRISSLYFDDIYRTAYNDKIMGLDVRKKYRIRFYGLSADYIRLEVKEKKGDMVCKRSVPLSREEYDAIISGDRRFLGEERFLDTAGEEFYLSDRTVMLSPTVLVDYVREAYICAAGNVRITFDMSLKTSAELDVIGGRPDFYNVFDNGGIILEVKYDSFIPMYIQELLSGVPLNRESVSKFVLCADKKLEVNKK